MKVLVQVLDVRTGIYQQGMIDEPVAENKVIENAVKHFTTWPVNWKTSYVEDEFVSKFGVVEDTSKVVTVIMFK